MTTSASREKKPGEFWRLCFDRVDPGVEKHIRVPNAPGFDIEVLGTAAEMHGPRGCCSCCKREAVA